MLFNTNVLRGKFNTFTDVRTVLRNSNPISSYLSVIDGYVTEREKTAAIVDNLCGSVASSPSFATSAILDKYDIDPTVDFSFEISQQESDLLLENIFSLNSGNGMASTVVGPNNFPYSFIRNNRAFGDGTECIISTQNHPKSWKDCFMYKRDGKIYVNPLLRSSNWVEDIPASLPDMIPTVNDLLNVICDLLRLDRSRGTVDSKVRAICNFFQIPFSNVFSSLQAVYQHAGSVTINTLVDAIDNVEIFISYIPQSIIYGALCSFYDVLQGMVVNSELTALLKSFVGAVRTGNLTSMIETLNASSPKVSAVAKGIKSALLQSGPIGALRYICESINNLFKDQPTGYAIFDNSSSSTQAFGVGLVTIISAAAQTIFNVLANVANVVISLIGAVGLGAFTLVKNMVNANVNAEYAIINSGENVGSWAPYAIFSKRLTGQQATDFLNINLPTSESTVKGLLDYAIKSGAATLDLYFVGLIMRIGYENVQVSDEGLVQYSAVIINLFPSAQNYSAIFNQLRGTILSDLRASVNLSLTTSSSIFFNSYFIDTIDRLASIVLSCIRTSWDTFVPTDDLVNDYDAEHDGVCYSQDRALRSRIGQNIVIGLCLIRALGPEFGAPLGILINSGDDGHCLPVHTVHLTSVPYYLTGYNIIAYWLVCAISDQNNYIVSSDGLYIACNEYSGGFEETYVCINDTFDKLSYSGDFMINTIPMFIRKSFSRYSTSDRYAPCIDISSRYDTLPLYTPAKYSRGSVLRAIAIGAAITIVATAILVTASFAVRRWVQRQRATRAANIESSWEQFKSDPSSENYSNYRKTVKRNNRFTKIFGGSKYDYESYWNGDVSDSSSGLFSFSGMEDVAEEYDSSLDTTSGIVSLIRGF